MTVSIELAEHIVIHYRKLLRSPFCCSQGEYLAISGKFPASMLVKTSVALLINHP